MYSSYWSDTFRRTRRGHIPPSFHAYLTKIAVLIRRSVRSEPICVLTITSDLLARLSLLFTARTG